MCKLTPKRQRFIEEYLIDLNASAAYRRSGFKSKNPDVDAAQLLVIPSIQKALSEAIQKRSERTEVTVDWVLEQLVEVSQRCMQKKPVMVYDRVEKEMVHAVDGNDQGIWTFDSGGANKSLELLGKHLAMFTEKHELTGKDGSALDIKITVDNKELDDDSS